MEFRSDARPSAIAGSWYPADPSSLAGQIETFFDAAKLKPEDLSGEISGLLTPHAGYRYSGRTAAYAYKAVRARTRELAVILSPYHPFFAGNLLTTAHSAYQTPLGNVPVAQDLLLELSGSLLKQGISLAQVAEDEEHSLEIQLPFLQTIWPERFTLLPLMIRSRDPRVLEPLAASLYNVIRDEDFLVVASSDLSHFYPLDIAEAMDAEMLRRVGASDPVGILAAEEEGCASACGAGAIAVMLWALKAAGAREAQVLNYSTSADTTGDRSSVVGYGSAVVYAPDARQDSG